MDSAAKLVPLSAWNSELLPKASDLGAMSNVMRSAVVSGCENSPISNEQSADFAPKARRSRGDQLRHPHEIGVPTGPILVIIFCVYSQNISLTFSIQSLFFLQQNGDNYARMVRLVLIFIDPFYYHDSGAP
jgi:hypothetical protein